MFFTQQTSVEYVESFGEIFALDSAAVSDVNLYAVVKFLFFYLLLLHLLLMWLL